VDAFGRVDAIVHCAAVLAYGRFEDLPADVFDQVIRTNLGGTANRRAIGTAAVPCARRRAAGARQENS
jgi:NAD(P)-dependent dehydrogenase (short-subunit alcohol dehydrogenase family)